MRRLVTAAAAAIVLLLSPARPAAAQPDSARVTLALVGGRIVDGYEGRPIDDGIILVAGERIAAG